jgi:hypothetical protein
MEFSTAGINTRSSRADAALMSMCASASATAAPPMSFFISAMPELDLMSRPPLSKHTPLPTRVKRGRHPRRGGDQRISSSRGACSARRARRHESQESSRRSSSPTHSLIVGPVAFSELASGRCRQFVRVPDPMRAY